MLPAGLLEGEVAVALELQMWSFGRDIRHPHGNVPVRLGMERHPNRHPGRSSTYCAWAGCYRITLRSFGIAIAPSTGSALWLGRRQPARRVGTAGDRPDDYADLCAITSVAAADSIVDLLPPLARWLADYEQQVVELLGAGWRRRVQRSHRMGGHVVDAADRWRRLADLVADA